MELLDAILQDRRAEAGPGLALWRIVNPDLAYENLRRILATVAPPEFGAFFEVLSEAMPANVDPDRALNNLERYQQISTGPFRPTALARDRPFLLELLLDLLGFSQFLSDVLIRYPHYLPWLGEPETLNSSPPPEALTTDLRRVLDPLETTDLRQRASVRWLRRRLLLSSVRVRRRLASESDFMREISLIAIAVIQSAVDHARDQLSERFGIPMEEGGDGEISARPAGFAVLAMGKLGGLELNFSSDIDLIFLYSAEGRTTGVVPPRGGPAEGSITNHDYFCRLSEAVSRFIGDSTDEGYLYRVDLRLRPDGLEGPLARSLGAFEIYHETQARPWERLALLKGLAVAGDEGLCRDVDALARGLVFGRNPGADFPARVRELKRMIDSEVESGPSAGREIKRGQGGIREIEFFVQTLQILHGTADPSLRERSTESAVAALVARGHIQQADAAELLDDYLFLRRVEHRLQMADLRQTHLIPEDPREVELLARRCGIEPGKDHSAGAVLLDRWKIISERVHRRFENFFVNFDADGTPDKGPHLSPAECAASALLKGQPEKNLIPLLIPFGLQGSDVIHTLQRMGGMHRSFYLTAHARELYAAILPKLIEAASRAARPLASLTRLESFLAASGSYASLFEIFNASPRLLAILVNAFGAADYLAETFIAHPEYTDYLLDPSFIAIAPSSGVLHERLREWTVRSADAESFAGALARLKRFEFTMTGLADISGMATYQEAMERLSNVADISIEASLDRAALLHGLASGHDASVRGFSVLAMGKLGTRELNYFSDLDLIYCWDDSESSTTAILPEQATLVAEAVHQSLVRVTDRGAAFLVDTRLRPEGSSAPLAPPISRYLDYYALRADLWEFQSVMKLRHVAGDPGLSARLIAGLENRTVERMSGTERRAEAASALRAMRLRIEQSAKIPSWVLCDFKKGPGGVMDLEFLAQFWQLLHLDRHRELLGRRPDDVFLLMATHGVLSDQEAASMCEDYLFLRRLESRSRLLFGTERSQAPGSGEKWESLCRAVADLLPQSSPDFRQYLLELLSRNRERFNRWLPPAA